VTGTDGNGCSNTGTVNRTVNPVADSRDDSSDQRSALAEQQQPSVQQLRPAERGISYQWQSSNE